MVDLPILDINEDDQKALFKSDGNMSSYLKTVNEAVEKHVVDLTTAKGRNATKTFAAEISRTKTKLDGLGKGLKDHWQRQVNEVDGRRKSMRDTLDAAKLKARKPLTDYEDDEQTKNDAVNDALNDMHLMQQIPYGASVESINERISYLADIRKRNDWRGKEEQATNLIETTLNIFNQVKQTIIEKIESERLQAEKDKRNEDILAVIEAERAAEKKEHERLEYEAKTLEFQRNKAAAEIREQLEAAQAENDRLKRERADEELQIKEATIIAAREADQAIKDKQAAADAEENRILDEKEFLLRVQVRKKETINDIAVVLQKIQTDIKDQQNDWDYEVSAELFLDQVISENIRHVKFT